MCECVCVCVCVHVRECVSIMSVSIWSAGWDMNAVPLLGNRL